MVHWREDILHKFAEGFDAVSSLRIRDSVSNLSDDDEKDER
jgi:hypothetical protein